MLSRNNLNLAQSANTNLNMVVKYMTEARGTRVDLKDELKENVNSSTM